VQWVKRLRPIPKGKQALPLRGVAATASPLFAVVSRAWGSATGLNGEEDEDFHLTWHHFGIISRQGGKS
jgi:hypothetical protein